MSDSLTVEDEVGYIALSPPEYVKLANARDSVVAHGVDLRHFVDHLQAAIHERPLNSVSHDEIENIIADYVGARKEA